MILSIAEITLPESIDAPDAGDFLACVQVRNAVEADVLGTHLLAPTPGELLPEYRSSPTRRRSHLTATIDGRVVGRAMVTTRPHSPGAGAYLMVDVLPAHRGHGVGVALLDRAEAVAHEAGETALKVSVAHTASTDGERIAAPTGFGDVPADDPAVRFLMHHGFALEQVARISVLDTTGLDERVAALQDDAQIAAGADYRLHSWVGPTPGEWLDDLAVLRTRMSTDAPMAGLAGPPDPWTAGRVVQHDAHLAEAPQTILTTAAEHVPSGRLAGFTEIVVPEGRPAATQEDTLVLREHRGHRLGMLMKSATARGLLSVAPHVEAVVTWNAEENRPMLDVNEAMGFRSIGYEGGWLKQP